MKNRYYIFLFCFIIASGLLTGCSKKDSKNTDLHTFVTSLKANGEEIKQEIMDIKLMKPIDYQADTQYHPFVEQESFVQLLKGNKSRNPLLNYGLSRFKLLGTLISSNKKWALVETPDKITHQVAVGTSIGSDGGEIIDISSNAIKVRTQNKVITLSVS